jgi:oligo-alginate lyase
VGTGYDTLYSVLSVSERQIIAGALINLGILPTFEDWLDTRTRIHSLDSMGHNWWAVCVSSAGVAALSLLGEEPRAPHWLHRIYQSLTDWFAFSGNVLENKTANFDSQGAFYESVNYANYALAEYLRFRLAYANALPDRKQPDYPPLGKSCEYFRQTFYPSSHSPLTVNFGDSASNLQVADTIRLLIETGFPHSSAGWYLAKTASAPFQALDFVLHKPVPKAAPLQLPRSILYSDIGWAMLRDSWKDDATLLAVKSGFTWNHAHADAGSFVLYHAGFPLIIDSGTCSYGNSAYTRYYVQSQAHNVILFNGQGEPSQDHLRAVKFPGHLHSLVDRMGVRYVYADATGPMAHVFARNYRHWLWIDNVILIFDDLLAYQEGNFDWLLHYEGKAQQAGNTVALVNGEARADIQFLYPESLDAHEEKGLAEHAPDRQVPYLAFRTRQSVRVQKFITAIVPHPPAGGSLPKVQPLSASDSIGVRIENGNTVTDAYLNLQADGRRMHVNSNNNIDGWETDAYLMAWTRPVDRRADPSGVTRFFVSCGSYLRRQGRVYLDSLAKIDAVWQPTAEPKLGK